MNPDSIRFAAFVIAFNRPKVLEQTLFAILQQSKPPDSILIVDNGNSKETEQIVEQFAQHNVLYYPMKENVGPAGAAAYALNRLAKEGYDWIYWGDEDDPPQFPDALERILKVATSADPDVAGAGAVGSLFNWEKGETERLKDEDLSGVIAVDSIGGDSQFILSNKVIQNVGVPDSRLFFGLYEPEYCLRVRRAGYKLVVDGDLMMEHRRKAGRLKLQRRREIISAYPYGLIWRRYYRTRNYIFMMRNTFGRPDLARREAFKALTRAVFSWARGMKYGLLFTRLQLKGIWDGYFERMGRTVLPASKI